MKLIIAIASIVLTLASCAGSKESRTNSETEAKISELINAKNYVFRAQTALPLRGRSIQLTSEYDMTVTNDSLIVWLPYFGRAFSAPIDPTQGGVQFTSTNFDYQVNQKKKGGWDISIKPNDTKAGEQLNLSIGTSGFGILQVISNNRQAISFNGHIEERRR